MPPTIRSQLKANANQSSTPSRPQSIRGNTVPGPTPQAPRNLPGPVAPASVPAPRSGPVVAPQQPLPRRDPPPAVIPVNTPQAPQTARFANSNLQIQELIRQIAANQRSGANNPQSSDFTGDASRSAQLSRVIDRLESGDFDFDPTQDAETQAFAVMRERQRQQDQNAAAERLAANPTDTSGFELDTRALREATGEDVAGFGAQRASQRRGEQLDEQKAALGALVGLETSDQSATASRSNQQQQLLSQLLGEQGRVQAGQAGATQQRFQNELALTGVTGGQNQQALDNQRRAEQDALAEALAQRQSTSQQQRDEIASEQAFLEAERKRRELDPRVRRGGGIQVNQTGASGNALSRV